MSLIFRETSGPGLLPVTAELPDGVIVGVIGDDTPAISQLLRLAAGLDSPGSGSVEASEPRRWLGPVDAFALSPAGFLAVNHTFSQHGALVRARARLGLERLRRGGATILLASQEQDLLRELCDEIWWIDNGALVYRGAPADTLEAYNRSVAARLRDWGSAMKQGLAPSMRRGDGRAAILALDLLDAAGRPTGVWHSGEDVAIRVTVRFEQAVPDPVIGIMLRTRIGLEVYGTNTELERLNIGAVAAGETIAVTYAFRCELCPQEYTLTAASHDRDGVWHDWMEDAVAFRVVDSRYTAGVANLRARAAVARA